MTAATITTSRLRLVPITAEEARKLLRGDFGGHDLGAGWPHADTLAGLSMPVETPSAQIWLVTLGGVVIGDCGTHGAPDAAGDVELGYGLAAPSRGRGYGTEVVVGLSQWLSRQEGVRRVVARGVLAGNTPSRRALERAGFALDRDGVDDVDYKLAT